jgi:putative ATP-dependent endonuclease of OLD family
VEITNGICVIWVEGPSDRIYIKHWLDLYCKSKKKQGLTEGKHNSFVMYGGSLLTYYDYDNEEQDTDFNPIELVSTSRYAFVVADSDIYSDRTDYKKADKRLIKRERESDNFGLWVTKGKEIENYVPDSIFLEIFTKDIVRRVEKPSADLLNGQTFKENTPFNP